MSGLEGQDETLSPIENRAGYERLISGGFGSAMVLAHADKYRATARLSEIEIRLKKEEENLFGKLSEEKKPGVGDMLGLLELNFRRVCLDEAIIIGTQFGSLGEMMLRGLSETDIRNSATTIVGIREVVKAGMALKAAITNPPDIQTVAGYWDEQSRQLGSGVDMVENGMADALVQNILPTRDTGKYDEATLEQKREERNEKQRQIIIEQRERADNFARLAACLRYPEG